MHKSNNDFVALIPAAGSGSRLGKLPFSKELLPLRPLANDPFVAAPGTPVAIEDSLQLLRENGVREAYIIVAQGKGDIAAYLEKTPVSGITVKFLCRESSPSVPHTLCTAIPHLAGRNAVLIFPDIVFHPRNIVERTIAEHLAHGVDVTLGLVPSTRGDKVDIVSCNRDGRVLNIRPKPGAGVSGWTWITATWSGRFSEFMTHHTNRRHRVNKRELYVGDVLNAAIQSGLSIGSMPIPQGAALDFGTTDDLKSLGRGDFFGSKETP